MLFRMLNLHLKQCFLPAGTPICMYSYLFEHHFGMLRLDWIIINHKNIQSLQINCRRIIRHILTALNQCDHHGKFCSDALLRLNADSTVHHVHHPLYDGHTKSCATGLRLISIIFS